MEVMEELKQRILQDGLVIDNRILKIDNFLNQQIDTNLINHVGQEFARRFKDVHIDRIVTIEASGIAVAYAASLAMGNLPIVFARKKKSLLTKGEQYTAKIYSYTILMGFFVAAACGYMAGLIGTSASPISGIGILGIIVSSLVVLGIGSSAGVFETMQGTQFATAFAIFITSVIVSIASISNDNLQDLKTGYLVGATPWKQQVALILGSIIGSFAIAPVLNLLYQAYGFTGALPRAGMDPTQALAAPQATLMTTIAQGIFSASLDWNYILFGVGVGIAAIIIDLILTKNTKSLALPPLAVGMGIYLPPTLEIPLVIGSVMGYLIHKSLKARAARRSPGHEEEDVEACNHRGVLFASGLIVGESLMGVIIALLIVVSVTSGGSENPLALVGKDFQSTADILGLLCFIAMIAIFVRHILITKFNPEDAESK